jgi:hypothetical protein
MSDTKPKPIKKKKGRKPGKFYIQNDDLVASIRGFYADGGKIPHQLGLYILKIVDGVAHSPNFINYSYRDEMESDAIWRITKALTDKGCIVHPDEILGDIIYDAEGNIIYKLDIDGEFAIDSNGDQVPRVYENKPFSYFSMIAWRAFQGRIKIEKKFQETTEAYKEKIYSEFESEYGICHTEDGSSDQGSNENSEF